MPQQKPSRQTPYPRYTWSCPTLPLQHPLTDRSTSSHPTTSTPQHRPSNSQYSWRAGSRIMLCYPRFMQRGALVAVILHIKLQYTRNAPPDPGGGARRPSRSLHRDSVHTGERLLPADNGVAVDFSFSCGAVCGAVWCVVCDMHCRSAAPHRCSVLREGFLWGVMGKVWRGRSKKKSR